MTSETPAEQLFCARHNAQCLRILPHIIPITAYEVEDMGLPHI